MSIMFMKRFPETDVSLPNDNGCKNPESASPALYFFDAPKLPKFYDSNVF
jgi:hypothetical protein